MIAEGIVAAEVAEAEEVAAVVAAFRIRAGGSREAAATRNAAANVPSRNRLPKSPTRRSARSRPETPAAPVAETIDPGPSGLTDVPPSACIPSKSFGVSRPAMNPFRRARGGRDRIA